MKPEMRTAYLRAIGIDSFVRRHGSRSDAVDDIVAVESNSAPANDSADEDFDRLRAEVASCVACPLHRTRTQTVFGVGNPDADWMIVGEAPGAEEDRRGEPFVGRAGQLLDEMLRAVGLDRSRVYIANMLKCRPPANRDPQAAELQACRGYLERQIARIDPRLILAVGRIAAQALLGSDAPVGRLRGKIHRLPGRAVPVIVTYHPAYLLRSPAQKAKAWQDLVLAQRQGEGSGE